MKRNKKQIVRDKLNDERKGMFGKLYKRKIKHGSLGYWAIEAAHNEIEKGEGKGPVR
jgi:hypothetical protein